MGNKIESFFALIGLVTLIIIVPVFVSKLLSGDFKSKETIMIIDDKKIMQLQALMDLMEKSDLDDDFKESFLRKSKMELQIYKDRYFKKLGEKIHAENKDLNK